VPVSLARTAPHRCHLSLGVSQSFACVAYLSLQQPTVCYAIVVGEFVESSSLSRFPSSSACVSPSCCVLLQFFILCLFTRQPWRTRVFYIRTDLWYTLYISLLYIFCSEYLNHKSILYNDIKHLQIYPNHLKTKPWLSITLVLFLKMIP